MCKLRAYVSEICSYVSVLTIVGFAIERYMAVCHPFRQNSEDLKRSMRFILVAWVIASFSALPIAVYINLDFVEYPPKSNRYSNESAICVMKTNDIPNFPLYGLSCFFFFLLPMAFIAVFYTRICLRIQTESFVLNVEGFVHGENKHAQLRKTIRILSAVVITFFICWAPFHVQRIMTAYNIGTPDIDRWLYPLTGCLYYFSATINPILYNLISAKYRDAFKETCCCSSRKHISRSAISSMRHSSMVSATGTRIESQVSPMRHVESKLLKNNLHTAVWLNSNDGNSERKFIANDPSDNEKIVEITEESCTGELKKSSSIIYTKNGLKRQMFESESVSNETLIWSMLFIRCK